jgi:Spy/CpxP family protein refolding chaperone
MKHRNLILATLLIGSLASAGNVSLSHAGPHCGARGGAYGEGMGHSEGRHDPLQRLMRQVALTDAQQSEIRAIIEASRTDTENLRQQLLDSRKAMRSLVTGSDYNIEKVRELADQQAKLRAELTVARVDTMHRSLQVLTAEQQAKLATLREQRMKGKNAMPDERQDD